MKFNRRKRCIRRIQRYAFNAEPMDERRAEAALENLAQARANLTRAFSQMSLKLRLVLTAEQWKELQKRQPGEGRGRK